MFAVLDRTQRLKILHASAVLQEHTGCSPLESLRVARLLTPAQLDQLWAARPAPTIREVATRLWLQTLSNLAVSIDAAVRPAAQLRGSRPARKNFRRGGKSCKNGKFVKAGR